MEKKRSKGVAFWGYLLLSIGIIYGVTKIITNKWDLNVIVPVLFVVMGIGILNLKNWARWIFLICMVISILGGILDFSGFIQSVNELSKEGLFLPAIVAFVMRFVIAITGIIFFSRHSIKEQFRKGA